MSYNKSWQIASEIVDMLCNGGNYSITTRQQEKIADIIGKRGPMHWNRRDMCWVEEQETIKLAAKVVAGGNA